MSKRILSALLAVLFLITGLPGTAWAVGEGNMEAGGGQTETVTGDSFWNGDWGIRFCVVDVASQTVVSATYDASNRNSGFEDYHHYGKTNKFDYRNGASLVIQKGLYSWNTPPVSIPTIVRTSGAPDIKAIKNYFTDETVIRWISDVTGMAYDTLIMPLLHPTTSAEDLYAFPQSPNITYSSGFIGCLKGEFEDNNLFTLWSDAARHLKTDEFVSEMNSVLDALKEKTLLNRKNMRSYCRSHSSAMMSGKEEQYGFRVDTDQYSYLFRLRVGAHDREIKTNMGTMPIEDYRELAASQRGFDSYADMRRQGYRLPSERNEDLSDVYCYCYRKDMLDAHMRQAERGISFLDEHCEERFRLPDGGRMRVTYANDDRQDFVCRYVDDYHFEMGTGSDTCCHINQFAEKMAQCGCLVEPLDKMPEQKKEEQIVFSCDGKNYFAEIEIGGQMERCPIRCVNGVRRFDRLNQQVKREVVYSFTTSDGVVHQLSPESTNRYKEFVERTVRSQAIEEETKRLHEATTALNARAL